MEHHLRDFDPALYSYLASLKAGLTAREREILIEDALRQLGWCVAAWPSWVVSLALMNSEGWWRRWTVGFIATVARAIVGTTQAFTPTRTIYIAVGARTGFARLPLLAHELTHALRSESSGRLVWTAVYLSRRASRLIEEGAARAAEILMRIRLEHADVTEYAVRRELEEEVQQLCSGGWPYFLSGAEWSEKASIELYLSLAKLLRQIERWC
ncbi:MAG: hypothetical protein KKH12_15950 [Gammaproteobacteria bacterium]|nr:hypothetical protein [Gammaproteobacteria bacterium]